MKRKDISSMEWKPWMKSKYHLTKQQYDRLWAEGGGRCAICLRPFSEELRPNIDHCHLTLEVRGFLCFSCNSAIGLLGDSVEMIDRAIKYLSKLEIERIR